MESVQSKSLDIEMYRLHHALQLRAQTKMLRSFQNRIPSSPAPAGQAQDANRCIASPSQERSGPHPVHGTAYIWHAEGDEWQNWSMVEYPHAPSEHGQQ